MKQETKDILVFDPDEDMLEFLEELKDTNIFMWMHTMHYLNMAYFYGSCEEVGAKVRGIIKKSREK